MFFKGQMKGFVAGILITFILTSVTFAAFAAGNLVQIQVNFDAVKKIVLGDREVSFADDSRPFIYNGKTYIALRPLFEQFGGKITWDSKTQTVQVGVENPPDTSIQSDWELAKVLEKALLAYMAESNDVNLKLFGDKIDVDTILAKLQTFIIDPKDGCRYGPYLENTKYPEVQASTYYPRESKGWEFIIDAKNLLVTVNPSESNSVKFIGQ